MKQKIAHITLVVNDYDKAIEYYTQKLNFDLIEDSKIDKEKRWVLVSPKGAASPSLLLAKAANNQQLKSVGNQTGGRVFLFLNTDDFFRDYNLMKDKGVQFIEDPRTETYGTVAVFEDLYGNLWDLIQSKN